MSQHPPHRQYASAADGPDSSNTIQISKQIVGLLSDLCASMSRQGSITPRSERDLSQLVTHTVQYLAQCPNAINTPLPLLLENDCVHKIRSVLNSKSTAEQTGDLFHKLYLKLSDLPVEEQLRHKLMNFLLLLLDAEAASPGLEEVRPPIVSNGSGSNGAAYGLQGSLVQSQLAKLAIKNSNNNNNNNNGSASEQNGLRMLSSRSNRSQNQSSWRTTTTSTTYSYDPTQSSTGLGQHPMPNYMDVLKRHKDVEAVHDTVQNAIYSFTGIQGKYLKKDVITGRFKLDPLSVKTLNAVQSGMLLRLSELGYYHDRVAKFANTATGFNAIGSMGQALISALKDELTRFHGQVALLQDQLNAYRQTQLRNYADREHNWLERQQDELTLMSLLSWYLEPLSRMQWLTQIADACQMRKGGELASVVYDFLENGDPMVNQLVHDMLTAICGPLVRMISKWMLEGGIEDGYGEFFVESLSEVAANRLWHGKFRLRLHMLPKFMTLELADKILKTGKSINFLREICEMQELVKSREELKRVIDHNVSQIFSYVQDTNWHAAIETCYQQTSKHVLDIMLGPHKLIDHLHGMRRYLLLGQGDFVSILIENMKEELDKQGNEIYAHDLSAMLDAALRCTNAQYDDPEILNHLDVVVQSPYPGDCGWDIISLQYTVQGPLATMLEATMPTYKALFKPLWRMKHMEFVLSMKIWKEQMGNSKALRSMNAEIGQACYGLHLFTSEIMHFVHQMQYYVLFEVIECNWVDLQKRMQQATALDDILDAHEKFLGTITVGCFVNTGSDMERNLEIVYDNIICLESWQSNFYDDCFKELAARQQHSKRIADSESSGSFGVTTEQIMERDQARKIFEQTVNAACRSLENIAMAYEKAVHGFLLALTSNDDPNLQLFGTRLDFNEYYKKRNTSLSVPLTFEHMRMSNVFSINSKNLIGSRYSMQPSSSAVVAATTLAPSKD